MDTILKVCKKVILPNPNLVKYPIFIENEIEVISKKLEDFKVLPPKLLRWVSLKILDGEEKILKSIEEHFNISIIDNSTLQNIRKMSIEKINLGREKLEENKNKTSNENKENFKDIIVSSIVNTAEKISNSVCTYGNNNYSARDRKIDKILTSKVFGLPIMI